MTVEMFLRGPRRHRRERLNVLREHRIDEAADARAKQDVPQIALPAAHLSQAPDVDARVRFVELPAAPTVLAHVFARVIGE